MRATHAIGHRMLRRASEISHKDKTQNEGCRGMPFLSYHMLLCFWVAGCTAFVCVLVGMRARARACVCFAIMCVCRTETVSSGCTLELMNPLLPSLQKGAQCRVWACFCIDTAPDENRCTHAVLTAACLSRLMCVCVCVCFRKAPSYCLTAWQDLTTQPLRRCLFVMYSCVCVCV